jgi:hypothetical protein
VPQKEGVFVGETVGVPLKVRLTVPVGGEEGLVAKEALAVVHTVAVATEEVEGGTEMEDVRVEVGVEGTEFMAEAVEVGVLPSGGEGVVEALPVFEGETLCVLFTVTVGEEVNEVVGQDVALEEAVVVGQAVEEASLEEVLQGEGESVAEREKEGDPVAVRETVEQAEEEGDAVWLPVAVRLGVAVRTAVSVPPPVGLVLGVFVTVGEEVGVLLSQTLELMVEVGEKLGLGVPVKLCVFVALTEGLLVCEVH